MKRLIKYRWPHATCGPFPTACWVAFLAGAVLAAHAGGGARLLYFAGALAALALGCTTMALAGHRRTERHTTELMADARQANDLLAERILGEFNTRIAALGLHVSAEQHGHLPAAAQAAGAEPGLSDTAHHGFSHGRSLPQPDGSGLTLVPPLRQKESRRAS